MHDFLTLLFLHVISKCVHLLRFIAELTTVDERVMKLKFFNKTLQI